MTQLIICTYCRGIELCFKHAAFTEATARTSRVTVCETSHVAAIFRSCIAFANNRSISALITARRKFSMHSCTHNNNAFTSSAATVNYLEGSLVSSSHAKL